jgi:hypothetical protein
MEQYCGPIGRCAPWPTRAVGRARTATTQALEYVVALPPRWPRLGHTPLII